jgi:hypothetical protein
MPGGNDSGDDHVASAAAIRSNGIVQSYILLSAITKFLEQLCGFDLSFSTIQVPLIFQHGNDRSERGLEFSHFD